jgi:hypothetical protein
MDLFRLSINKTRPNKQFVENAEKAIDICRGGYDGGAIGSWLSGRFFDFTHSYEVNFLIASAAMLISAALIWKASPGSVRWAPSLETR